VVPNKPPLQDYKKWMAGTTKLAFIAPPNDDDFMIEIICYDSNEKTSDSEIKSGYNHVSFMVQNLDKTIEELAKKNIPVERSFSVPAIGLRVAFISDTFGNAIELCEKMK
jgi:lactoylglutathione lyase